MDPNPTSEASMLLRCGRVLFGPHAEWTAPMARALDVAAECVDAMAAGRLPVPAALWRRIAVLLQERENELIALKADALKWANGTEAGAWRVHSIAGRVVQVERSPDGTFPIVEYCRPGRWPTGSPTKDRSPPTLSCFDARPFA